ncbi:MAG: Rieske (2Fe-2S) protein [Pseudomonadota bacterium]
MSRDTWWAVALSEQVKPQKTLAVVCGGEQIALYRDAAGKVFALEDRCPHRRVLLSAGVVQSGGLQCPYHGWTFDGASGKCTDIPNLRRDENIPAKYEAVAYPAAELNGFIHVWLGQGVPGIGLPSEKYLPFGRQFYGSAVASIGLHQYLDVMLDGPQCLLAFPGVQITDFYLGDPRRDGDHLVLDRGAVWRGKGAGPAFVRDHPLLVRTRVPLTGGAIIVQLLDAEEEAMVTMFIGATENRRGTTSLSWRGFRHAHAAPDEPFKATLRRLAGRAPFDVFSQIDGAAIAALAVAPSLERRPIVPGIPIHFASPPCAGKRAMT